MVAPKVDTICDDCGFRTTHPTRTRAFASMQAHEDETLHDSQMFSTPDSGGWVRFHQPRYLMEVS